MLPGEPAQNITDPDMPTTEMVDMVEQMAKTYLMKKLFGAFFQGTPDQAIDAITLVPMSEAP